LPVVLGCTDSTAFNYSPSANTDNQSCVSILVGCTDALAFNFNPLANQNDGSCTAVVLGCLDATAFNYQAAANTSDGSCITLVEGCTDALAFNYNPAATTEMSPSNCTAVVLGCIDPRFREFVSIANTDDGSCLDLWSDLYAGVTSQFDAATTLIDSLSTSLSLLSADFQQLTQNTQDSSLFYATQIAVLNSNHATELFVVQNQISELEDNLASLAASHQAELSQAALEASNLLALTELSFQLDSVSMLLDFENQLTDLADEHTAQINLLNAEDAIEDALYDAIITDLKADSAFFETQVASLQIDSAAFEVQIAELNANVAELTNNTTFLTSELAYYSAPIMIDLEQGWNIIGFSLHEQMDVVASLEILGDKLHLIKNNSARIYWPEFGFNNIGDLLPGQGYQLRMNEEYQDFTFPYIPGERIILSPNVPQWALDMDVSVHPNDIRSLVKVVNMLGQEVNPAHQEKGTPLIYLYNDASVEKKIN
jgi:hypothetical protein